MNNNLDKYLDRFSQCRIAVIGDLMLDRYIWGRASRISQEAPVPVVHVNKESTAPGGAANVVRNILTLNGQSTAFGIIGDDEHGVTLRSSLTSEGANTTGVMQHPNRPTTVKTRVLAGNQQVVRVDRENTTPLVESELCEVRSSLLKAIENHDIDAVIVEDYAKGLLSQEFIQEIVDCGVRNSVPVSLDPHPGNNFKVTGLELMTPNRAEAFALAGVYYQAGKLPLSADKPLLEVGRKLQKEWNAKYLLITLGSHGMALFRDGQEPLHVPTKAKEVFDVSGAGDTVMATFTLALLADATPLEAMQISNEAAGIVVGKVGTVSVELDTLREALTEHFHE